MKKYYPKRIALYPEILRRKLNPDSIPSAGDARTDRILRDSFGVLVYQSQARLLKDIGYAFWHGCKSDGHPLRHVAPRGLRCP